MPFASSDNIERGWKNHPPEETLGPTIPAPIFLAPVSHTDPVPWSVHGNYLLPPENSYFMQTTTTGENRKPRRVDRRVLARKLLGD